MFGTFMVVLDTTVVNVSLPYIAGSLSSTVEETTWALTSYLAANAIILPERFIFDPPYLRRGRTAVDWWGIVYLALGIGALQVSLDKGEQQDWLSSPFITTLLIVAFVGLLALVARELTTAEPVLDL